MGNVIAELIVTSKSVTDLLAFASNSSTGTRKRGDVMEMRADTLNKQIDMTIDM